LVVIANKGWFLGLSKSHNHNNNRGFVKTNDFVILISKGLYIDEDRQWLPTGHPYPVSSKVGTI
jgi:hypothetical protein